MLYIQSRGHATQVSCAVVILQKWPKASASHNRAVGTYILRITLTVELQIYRKELYMVMCATCTNTPRTPNWTLRHHRYYTAGIDIDMCSSSTSLSCATRTGTTVRTTTTDPSIMNTSHKPYTKKDGRCDPEPSSHQFKPLYDKKDEPSGAMKGRNNILVSRLALALGAKTGAELVFPYTRKELLLILYYVVLYVYNHDGNLVWSAEIIFFPKAWPSNPRKNSP